MRDRKLVGLDGKASGEEMGRVEGAKLESGYSMQEKSQFIIPWKKMEINFHQKLAKF